jgi:hypothetical protein
VRDPDYQPPGALALRMMATATIIELCENVNRLAPLFVGMNETESEKLLIRLFGDDLYRTGFRN